jgi:hypothetical protein
MIRLDTIFEGYSEAINKIFEQLYPNYPCYPKFSFMRLMVVIWRREVFDRVSSDMFKVTKTIMGNFHKEQFDHGLKLKNSIGQKSSPTSHYTFPP